MSEKPEPPQLGSVTSDSQPKETLLSWARDTLRLHPRSMSSVIRNSSYGKLGARSAYYALADDFKNVKYRPVFEGHRQLINAFNQEKVMTLEELKSLKPGDRVLYDTETPAPNGTIHTSTVLVFIGFDPERHGIALLRDVGNPNGTIRAIDTGFIKPLPPKPVEHVAEMLVTVIPGSRTHMYQISHWPTAEGVVEFAKEVGRKAIDATVTEDGLVLVKYIDQPVEDAAMLAAHKNPAKFFSSNLSQPVR